MAEKRGLGRGLSALMGDPIDQDISESHGATTKDADQVLPIERVQPNPDQPRRDYDREELQNLANSIEAKGILQPLLVRPIAGTPNYEIIAGERRWRAAQMAKIHQVPVLIREYSDEEVLEVAIIENVQRSDLNPIEEALAYRQLMDRFGHTQEKLASSLSKSRSHIANQMRLLNLPDLVMSMVRKGELSAGHARALLTAENPAQLARKIVTERLSVRETERLAKGGSKPKTSTKTISQEKDADTRALERDLTATLGMKVAIDQRGDSQSGRLSITYKNLDELDQLCQSISAMDRLAK